MGLKSVKAAPFALWAVQAVLDAANCIFKIQPFKSVLRIIDMAPAASSPRYQLAPAGRRQASCWVPIVTGSVLVGVHCWWWCRTVTRTETPTAPLAYLVRLATAAAYCTATLLVVATFSVGRRDVLLHCAVRTCGVHGVVPVRPGQAAGALDQPRPQVWTSV